jgi:hypothetical protein
MYDSVMSMPEIELMLITREGSPGFCAALNAGSKRIVRKNTPCLYELTHVQRACLHVQIETTIERIRWMFLNRSAPRSTAVVDCTRELLTRTHKWKRRTENVQLLLAFKELCGEFVAALLVR